MDRILSNDVQKIRITSKVAQKNRILSDNAQKIRITANIGQMDRILVREFSRSMNSSAREARITYLFWYLGFCLL